MFLLKMVDYSRFPLTVHLTIPSCLKVRGWLGGGCMVGVIMFSINMFDSPMFSLLVSTLTWDTFLPVLNPLKVMG